MRVSSMCPRTPPTPSMHPRHKRVKEAAGWKWSLGGSEAGAPCLVTLSSRVTLFHCVHNTYPFFPVLSLSAPYVYFPILSTSHGLFLRCSRDAVLFELDLSPWAPTDSGSWQSWPVEFCRWRVFYWVWHSEYKSPGWFVGQNTALSPCTSGSPDFGALSVPTLLLRFSLQVVSLKA